ncbi:Hypothetical predicted protein [Paramuricea clavata]|uniref:Uncharacterized protein n=1 Tax=Paramuricea clavata TaxID=317549 RepID=A0A7D9D6Z1_PARCT|nr:Hypothetical predicted protein [Paramuricea clavata]
MTTLRSHNHTVYTERQVKVALSPDDDKRYILDDKIRTLALGHKDIPDVARRLREIRVDYSGTTEFPQEEPKEPKKTFKVMKMPLTDIVTRRVNNPSLCTIS